jgi:hypothetical protein
VDQARKAEGGDPLTWESLLDVAVMVGLSHDEFWRMSLREFERVVRIRNKQKQDDYELAWWRTAAQTSVLMNMIGGAAAGSKWVPVEAKSLYSQWTGGDHDAESAKERLERASEMHSAKVARLNARYKR